MIEQILKMKIGEKIDIPIEITEINRKLLCEQTELNLIIISFTLINFIPHYYENRTELINKFAPFVYLHPSESHFPCSIEWYLPQCDFIAEVTNLSTEVLSVELNPPITLFPREPPNPIPLQPDIINLPPEETKKIVLYSTMNSNLLNFYSHQHRLNLTDEYPISINFLLSPHANNLDNIYKGEYLLSNPTENVVQSSYYCNFIEPISSSKHIIMQYIFFYSLNDDIFRGKLPMAHPGRHEGDWEHVDIHIEYNSTSHQYELNRVYFAAHGNYKTGEIHYPNEIEVIDNTHPVVFSALPGHASYNIPFNINGKLDSTGRGFSWVPYIFNTVVDLTDIDNPIDNFNNNGVNVSWCLFDGEFGSRSYQCGTGSSPFYGGWILRNNKDYNDDKIIHQINNKRVDFIRCNSIVMNYINDEYRFSFPTRVKYITCYALCPSSVFINENNKPAISFDLVFKVQNIPKVVYHVDSLPLTADMIYYCLDVDVNVFATQYTLEYKTELLDIPFHIENLVVTNVEVLSQFNIEIFLRGLEI